MDRRSTWLVHRTLPEATNRMRPQDRWLWTPAPLSHSQGPPTFVPPLFAGAYDAQMSSGELLYPRGRCHDEPREALEVATASGEMQHSACSEAPRRYYHNDLHPCSVGARLASEAPPTECSSSDLAGLRRREHRRRSDATQRRLAVYLGEPTALRVATSRKLSRLRSRSARSARIYGTVRKDRRVQER